MNLLREITSVMSDKTILYIETPYENLISSCENLSNIHKKKKHWHEHINFFNENSFKKLFVNSGLRLLGLSKLSISGETSDYVFQICCSR